MNMRFVPGRPFMPAVKTNFALIPAQIENITLDREHAHRINLPFTRFITIHWKAAGVALDAMAKATGHFLDLMSKFLARHGHPLSWIYVHENGITEGWHCHILVHVKQEMISRLTQLQKRWIERIAGKTYKRNAIKSRPIGGRLGLEICNPALHRINEDQALHYICKQTTLEALQRFTLTKYRASAPIIGKRAGTSQNIGKAARMRYAPAGTPKDPSGQLCKNVSQC